MTEPSLAPGDAAAREALAAPPAAASLEHSLRQVGKAVLRLNARLDAMAPGAGGGASGGAAGGAFPPACAALADAHDAVGRLEERLAGVGASGPGAAAPAPPGRASFLGRLLGRRGAGASAAAEAAELRAVCEGLGLLRAQLAEALGREGFEAIPREGAFDAARHRVVATEPGAPPGRIVRTVQGGWRAGERIVRAALVVVGAARAEGPGPAPSA